VQQGKALYVGVSSYSPAKTREAVRLLEQYKVPCLIHQPSYNMLNRWIEEELLDTLEHEGVGCIAFTALAQGILTDKYLNGIPAGARINQPGGGSLQKSHLSEENLNRVRGLNQLAQARGQTLAQMALAWVLRDPRVTTTLIGASSSAQIRENVGALANLSFTPEELKAIDAQAQEGHLNLWEKSSRGE
jgi:L-glyceraldehyde 3-phosphate reductase